MAEQGCCGVTALVRADGGAWCGGACAIPICSLLLVVREGCGARRGGFRLGDEDALRRRRRRGGG